MHSLQSSHHVYPTSSWSPDSACRSITFHFLSFPRFLVPFQSIPPFSFVLEPLPLQIVCIFTISCNNDLALPSSIFFLSFATFHCSLILLEVCLLLSKVRRMGLLDPCHFYEEALWANGVVAAFGIPDSCLKRLLSYFAATKPVSEHLVTANEGAAVALAAGYYLSTRKIALAYMQNSGFANALKSIAVFVGKISVRHTHIAHDRMARQAWRKRRARAPLWLDQACWTC